MLAAHLMDTLALLMSVWSLAWMIHSRMKRLERMIERNERPACNCFRYEQPREEPVKTVVEPSERAPLPEARARYNPRKFA
jgi:hypothetical protein